MDKRLLLICMMAGLSAQTMQGAGKVYGRDPGTPSFEFYNKGVPVYLAVRSGGSFVESPQKEQVVAVAKGQKVALWPDISKETEILIWREKPASIAQKPNRLYKVGPLNKTVYVTWNSPDKPLILRGQTGKGKGLSGMSASGNSLVTPGNITRIIEVAPPKTLFMMEAKEENVPAVAAQIVSADAPTAQIAEVATTALPVGKQARTVPAMSEQVLIDTKAEFAQKSPLEAFPLLKKQGVLAFLTVGQIDAAPDYKEVLVQNPRTTAEDVYRLMLGLENKDYTMTDKVNAFRKISNEWNPDNRNDKEKIYARTVIDLLKKANVGLNKALTDKMTGKK